MIASFSLVFLLLSSIETRSLNRHRIDSKENYSLKLTKGILSNGKWVENYDVFSPRMDYDEWTPLGRGDPLKNDPTYDYVPPVLERVRYWMEPSQRTPVPTVPNPGAMATGSRTEFPDGTRFSTSGHQINVSKEAESRLDASSFLNPFFELLDVPRTGSNFDSNNNFGRGPGNKPQRPHHSHDKKRKTQPPSQVLQRPLHTILMPPPPPQPSVAAQTFPSFASPATKTIIRNSNGNERKTDSSPPTFPTTVNPTALANAGNAFGPVAISISPEAEMQIEGKRETAANGSQVLDDATIRETNERLPTNVPRFKHRPDGNATNPPTAIMSPLPKEIDRGKDEENLWLRHEGGALAGMHLRPATDPVVTAAKINAVTTDAPFKGRRQPSEPVGGPFYLIVQGHSKVKTYGASQNGIGQPVASNEIKRDDDDNQRRRFQKKSLRFLEWDHGQGKTAENFGGNGRRESDDGKVFVSSVSREDVSTRASEPSAEESDSAVNLENLMALGDDYGLEHAANLFVNPEGSPFGHLTSSIFGETDPEDFW